MSSVVVVRSFVENFSSFFGNNSFKLNSYWIHILSG